MNFTGPLKLKRFIILFSGTLLFACQSSQTNDETKAQMSEQEIIEIARGIHERVITLDTHNDINTGNFTAEKNYTQNLDTQVNIPKMEEGGLDVSWMIVYTGQGELTDEGYASALENAMDKFSAIHRLCEELAPDKIELALTSDDVRRISKSGKKVAMIGVENGYPVGTDITNVQKFSELGARYMSLSHNGHSQLCDSNTGERDSVWLHNGVSDLGKQVIEEMNKWGIMIDLSHPSKESNLQTIALSKAPVMASHSSARALCGHSRNMDDEQLLALKDNGGVIQTVAFKSYVNTEKNNARRDAERSVLERIAAENDFEMKDRSDIRAMDNAAREEYFATYSNFMKEAKPIIDNEVEAEAVNVSDFADHIDYLVKLIGVKHVGISSDFDGGGGVDGWNDASETFNVTLELVRRGYSEEEIGLMWSGNLLRVLDEVQKVAEEIQAEA